MLLNAPRDQSSENEVFLYALVYLEIDWPYRRTGQTWGVSRYKLE